MVPSPRTVPARPKSARRHAVGRSRRARGQSVTEFALILPVLLAFMGLSIDFARVFQVRMTLESATRDAAEAAASGASTSAGALAIAKRVVCLQAQNVPGFMPSGAAPPANIEQCLAPNVTVPSFSVSTTSPGATSRYPIGSATVQTTLPFQPMFAYPFLTTNGTWNIVVHSSFSIVQGRQ